MLLQIDTHTYLRLIYIDALPYDFKIHFDAFWQIDMMYVYIYIDALPYDFRIHFDALAD